MVDTFDAMERHIFLDFCDESITENNIAKRGRPPDEFRVLHFEKVDPTRYKCQYCKKTFSNPSNVALRAHLSNTMYARYYKTKLCLEITPKVIEVKKEMTRYFDSKPLKNNPKDYNGNDITNNRAKKTQRRSNSYPTSKKNALDWSEDDMNSHPKKIQRTNSFVPFFQAYNVPLCAKDSETFMAMIDAIRDAPMTRDNMNHMTMSQIPNITENSCSSSKDLSDDHSDTQSDFDFDFDVEVDFDIDFDTIPGW